MIASRYGALPVVRETGGLYDSIKPYWIDNGEIRGNGFTFANYYAHELLAKSEEAIDLFLDKPAYRKLASKVMGTDFSWSVSAKKYMEMYNSL